MSANSFDDPPEVALDSVIDFGLNWWWYLGVLGAAIIASTFMAYHSQRDYQSCAASIKHLCGWAIVVVGGPFTFAFSIGYAILRSYDMLERCWWWDAPICSLKARAESKRKERARGRGSCSSPF